MQLDSAGTQTCCLEWQLQYLTIWQSDGWCISAFVFVLCQVYNLFIWAVDDKLHHSHFSLHCCIFCSPCLPLPPLPQNTSHHLFCSSIHDTFSFFPVHPRILSLPHSLCLSLPLVFIVCDQSAICRHIRHHLKLQNNMSPFASRALPSQRSPHAVLSVCDRNLLSSPRVIISKTNRTERYGTRHIRWHWAILLDGFRCVTRE